MVKFDTENTPESSFIDELNTIKIDDIPIPPEQFRDKDKQKLLKKYSKKTRADVLTGNIEKLRKTKEKYLTTQNIIEQEYVYHRSLAQKIKEFFGRKTYIVAGIIYNNTNLKWYRRPVSEDNTIKIRKTMYILNKQALLHSIGTPVFMYYDNNPNPIKFDSTEFTPVVTSNTLYNMWQSKIVRDIFASGITTKGFILTAGMIIAIGVAAMLIISSTGEQVKEPLLLLIPWRKIWRRT